MKRHLFAVLLIYGLLTILFASCGHSTTLVTGSFSPEGEAGLNILTFSSSTGKLNHVSSFNAGPNPSFFCFSEKNHLIYAINEVNGFMGAEAGGITTIVHDGKFRDLRKAGEIAVPTGGPCYVSIDPLEEYLLVANYGGGSSAVVKLDKTGIPVSVTDTIIYNSIEGKVSHAHMIDFDPAGNFVYLTDLGLDRVLICSLDRSSGRLLPAPRHEITFPAGTGPRHFVINNAGTVLYVLGELNSTVSVFKLTEDQEPELVQVISSLRSSGGMKNHSAHIEIDSRGRFLYASNRGENTIAVFGIAADGKLELKGHSDSGGDWPRNFTIDPENRFILVGNQRSGNISVFRIDQESGIPSEKVSEYSLQSPTCLRFSVKK